MGRSGGRPAADPRRVDLGDATLLPGLVEGHSHLTFDAGPAPALRLPRRTGHRRRAPGAARARPAAGLRGDHGARPGLPAARRCSTCGAGSSASGRQDPSISLPRILASGPPVTTVRGHCWFLGGEVTDQLSAGRLVERIAATGADVVKVMVSGGFMTAGSPKPYDVQLSPAHLATVTCRRTVARAAGRGARARRGRGPGRTGLRGRQRSSTPRSSAARAPRSWTGTWLPGWSRAGSPFVRP